MLTSLKLSKLLQENGFEGESETYFVQGTDGNGNYSTFEKEWRLMDESRFKKNFVNFYPAYDILNDLCVTYGKQMFGESLKGYPPINYVDITSDILSLLQQNKQDEAENYIWEHTILNPKNK